ncbi:hypothetical protein PR048_026949 [Dryococelus australis]|uniref:Uncharacterized protein n=1 Tax=Dryococelus australis TaxID=614101 RepID=A0ABQ9GMQ0_9NEOP|nr:hypothetical protein PR048_026949 [Dryococelus australis]
MAIVGCGSFPYWLSSQPVTKILGADWRTTFRRVADQRRIFLLAFASEVRASHILPYSYGIYQVGPQRHLKRSCSGPVGRAIPNGAAWLDYSPSTYANRVRFPAESLPDFRTWKSCRTMLQVVSRPPNQIMHSGAAPYLLRFTLIGSQDLDYQLGSPLVDDRRIMNVVKYRVVSGLVWTNRTMVSSITDTNKTGILAVVDIAMQSGIQSSDARRANPQDNTSPGSQRGEEAQGGRKYLGVNSGPGQPHLNRKLAGIPPVTNIPYAPAPGHAHSSPVHQNPIHYPQTRACPATIPRSGNIDRGESHFRTPRQEELVGQSLALGQQEAAGPALISVLLVSCLRALPVYERTPELASLPNF